MPSPSQSHLDANLGWQGWNVLEVDAPLTVAAVAAADLIRANLRSTITSKQPTASHE